MKDEQHQIERKIGVFLEHIAGTERLSLIDTYEAQVDKLEDRKALLQSRIASVGRPVQGFEETYRTAFEFLKNLNVRWYHR